MNTESRSRGARGCLIGVGVLFVIAGALVAVAFFYGRSLIIDQTRNRVVEIVDETHLGDDQKKAVKDQVDRLATHLKNSDVDLEQAGKAAEKHEPLLDAFVYLAIRTRLDRSSLAKEEIETGKQTLDRLGYGVVEGKITRADRLRLRRFGPDKDDREAWRNLDFDKEQLAAFLAEAKTIVEAYGIPEDCPEVDYATPTKEAVDAIVEATSK